jgi:hypothetical protein
MRFLVFNLVVFMSIGYLFTAAPGQSVGSWLDGTINSVGDVITNQSEIKSDKKLNVSLPSKPETTNHFDPDKSNVQVSGQPSSGKGSNQINVEKIQKTISDAINANLRQIVSNLRIAEPQTVDVVKPDQAVTATSSDEAGQIKPDKPVPVKKNENASTVVKTEELAKKSPQKSTADTEEALAKAFRELYPADTSKTTAPDATLPMIETQPVVTFMTASDRQQALSELIQNLQLTYITRTGN